MSDLLTVRDSLALDLDSIRAQLLRLELEGPPCFRGWRAQVVLRGVSPAGCTATKTAALQARVRGLRKAVEDVVRELRS